MRAEFSSLDLDLILSVIKSIKKKGYETYDKWIINEAKNLKEHQEIFENKLNEKNEAIKKLTKENTELIEYIQQNLKIKDFDWRTQQVEELIDIVESKR